MSICPITKSITDPLANKWNEKNNINKDIIEEYNDNISQGATASKAFASAAQSANQATLQLISSAKGGAVSEEALNAALQKSTFSAKAGQAALNGLASAGSMVALWAVDKGIEMAVTALNNYIHRVEIAKDKIQEISSSIDSSNQTFQSHAELVEEAIEIYSRFANGVNLTDNTNLSLSNEDFATFLALNNELAEVFPQLLVGLDEQNNAILKLGTNARSSTDDLQELIEQEKELNNFQIAQSVPELFSNVKTVLTDYIQETKKLQAQLSSSENSFSHLTNFASGNFTAFDENLFQLQFEYPVSDKIGVELSNIMSRAVQTFLKSSDLPSEELYANLFTMDFSNSYDENGIPLYHTLLDASSLTEKERNELFSIIQKEADAFKEKATDILGDVKTQLTLTSKQADNTWSYFLPNLLYQTRSKQTYKNLDADLQKLAEQMIVSLDYSKIIQDMETNDPYAYILEHIITPLQNLSDNDKIRISNLFSEELSQQELEKLASALNWNFSKLGVKIPLDLFLSIQESAAEQQSAIQEILDKNHQTIQEALDANHQKMSATWNLDIDFSDPNLNLEEFLCQELAAYNLSETVLNNLITAYSQAQHYMTLALQNGAAERLSQMGLELDAVQSFADALTIVSGGGPVDNWMLDADGYYGDSQWMGDLLKYGKALDNAKLALNAAIPVNTKFAGSQGQIASSTSKATSALDEQNSALEAQKSALEAQKSALEKQKQHYEDVIQAINWFYDKQIGKVQTLIDALEKENKLLEKRKGNYDMALSSIDRFYEREIQQTKDRQNAIQEKIDALKAENEEHQKSYELEKAAYELERARNQRTDQIYVQGKGMVYVSNDDAVREAENTYDNLLMEQQVSVLEKQKADLDLAIAKLEEYRQMWSEVSDSYQFAQQDMMMSQLLGATWESDLLDGRMETLSLFRDTYNELQAEINSNEQLIASYEEKKEYYQGLKEQWEELTGKYQEETYIQLLTSEFGNNYENELLNGRTGRWTKFSEDYAGIQKQLKDVTDQIENLAARMESYAARMESAAARANAAANSISEVSIPSVSGNLPRYRNDPIGGGKARGGIISQKDSNFLDYLARSVGEDHLVPLQEGEAVIPKGTVRENSALIEALLSGNPKALEREHRLGDFPEDQYPDLQKALLRTPFPAPPAESLNITEHASATTLQFYGDLTFPNIHSGDEARKLVEELSRLSTRGRQYFHRQ